MVGEVHLNNAVLQKYIIRGNIIHLVTGGALLIKSYKGPAFPRSRPGNALSDAAITSPLPPSAPWVFWTPSHPRPRENR